MNYYQPMIDYLDLRDATEKSERENLQLPHLPWNNERYIKEYDPKKPIKLHNREVTDRIAKRSQDAARRNINNFDVKRSYFGAIATADATKLLRRLPKTSALEAVYKKDVNKIIEDVKNLEMDAYYRYKDGERRLLADERENFPVELKRAIKGKSANQIRNILLADSMKNMRESSEEDARVFRQCYSMAQTKRHARSLSETRAKKQENELVMLNVNQNVAHTLENVKKELNSFTDKTEEFLNDTRYRLNAINNTLNDQENCYKKWRSNRRLED